MPRGPKGEKRPADAIGNAIMIAKIATGEIEDITTEDGKNAAAVALGRMGGKARAAAGRRRSGKRSPEGLLKNAGESKRSLLASKQSTQEGDGFLSVAESAHEPDRYGDESSANP